MPTPMPTPETSLPGRSAPIPTADVHFVSGRSLHPPFPDRTEVLIVGLGCFWGAERLFWSIPGVWVTMVGYAGGLTPNPTYREVCSGGTGHTEVVRVVYEPGQAPLASLLQTFWEAHDPTQGMRQGNDVGTQYRSAIYATSPAQLAAARASAALYEGRLRQAGRGAVTTEIRDTPPFFYAEDYHQQYLAKNPGGYCGLAGTGVRCPLPHATGA